MASATPLTWYGGFIGVLSNMDRELHLVADDGLTFCKIRDGLRPVTRRAANAPGLAFCPKCNARAQLARRDV